MRKFLLTITALISVSCSQNKEDSYISLDCGDDFYIVLAPNLSLIQYIDFKNESEIYVDSLEINDDFYIGLENGEEIYSIDRKNLMYIESESYQKKCKILSDLPAEFIEFSEVGKNQI